jgi:hypothetical protein
MGDLGKRRETGAKGQGHGTTLKGCHVKAAGEGRGKPEARRGEKSEWVNEV